MNDKFIFSDGINVYATFESKVNKLFKSILILLNVFVYSLLLFAITQIPEEKILNYAFPILLLTVLSFLTLTKYTLWNIYGREILIINTKSFSYQHDYGWFNIKMKTIKTERGILFGIDDQLRKGNKEFVTIWFEHFDENDVPKPLYNSSIKIEIDSYQQMSKLIHELNDSSYDFSLN